MFGNKIFEKSLVITREKDRNDQPRNKNKENVGTHALYYSREAVESLSRETLVEKIKEYENEAYQLRKENNDNKIKLQDSKKISEQNIILEKQVIEDKEKIASLEKALLGWKFDKAFN